MDTFRAQCWVKNVFFFLWQILDSLINKHENNGHFEGSMIEEKMWGFFRLADIR